MKDSGKTFARIFKRLFNTQEVIVLIPLIVLCTIATIANPNFLNPKNLGAMARTLAPWGLLAIGESLIIIGGQIDISIGSMVSLGTVFFANAIVNWNLPVPAAMLMTAILTVALSLFNGYCIICKKIPAFLASIAMLYICKGAANAMTNARQIMLSTKELQGVTGTFMQFAQKEFFNINYSFVIFIVLCLVFQFVLRKTPFGRQLYAAGDNSNVATIAGIGVKGIQLSAFAISGLLVALTAVLVVGKEGVASPKYGEGWELTVVASTAIGGISLVGGSGTMIGTMIGAFVMAAISNILILLRINQHYQSIILGIIIVLSVVLDVQRRKKLVGK